MSKVKKILAALCLSERSQGVLDTAKTLSQALDATLVVINVINVRDIQDVSSIKSMGYDVSPDEYVKDVKEERRERLFKLLEEHGLSRQTVKARVRIGHPVEKILHSIEDEKADLVVIGAKGRTNLPQLLMGSVAEKIFRHSPVTVVSHRNREKAGR